MGNEGGWTARGGLYPRLGLSEVSMSQRSASHRPKHAQRTYETSHYHWSEFQIHAFHVVPSIGPIVSVTTLHGQSNSL